MLRQNLIDCERFFLGVKHVNGDTLRYRVFPARCHSWDCPVCARAKGLVYRNRLRPLFEGGQLWMYTLTFFHSVGPLDAWANVAKCWNRFRTAAAKKYGAFSYARVLESHSESPYPHLHILADKRFGDLWLNRELLAAGFGYQAKCSQVTSDHAAWYITKYLTKPWTNKEGAALRKTLHLRVITFGGHACTRAMAGTPWELIAKTFVCQEAIDNMRRDLEWKYGQNYHTTFSREFDANAEYTFVIRGPGYSAGEVQDIVSEMVRKDDVLVQELFGGVRDVWGTSVPDKIN